MAKLTVDVLKTAYEELIDVLGLIDKKKKPLTVPADADGEFLRNKIVDCLNTEGLIQDDDTFSPETEEVLEALKEDNEAEIEEDEEPAEEEAKPVRKGAAKPAAPAAKEKAPAAAKEKKGPIKKAGEEGKPGIIQTIVSLIEGAGKKGITKEEILDELKENFPDRNEQSMKNTINVQVPARISKEKFKLVKLEGNRYAKA